MQIDEGARSCALFVHPIGAVVSRRQGMAMEAAFRERRDSRSLSSSASPSPSAVFFDLDNTLVETRRADGQTCRKQRPRVPLRVSTNRLEYFNESMHFLVLHSSFFITKHGFNERELTTLVVCVYLQLAEELTREYGIPEDASAKITATYLKQFRKCPDNATLTLDAWRTILWSKALGHKYSHLAKKVYERWLYLRYHYMMLAPNTASMLRQFRKKYLLGLITNGPSNAQWEKIYKLSLEQYFDVILVSGDLPWEKPEAEIFQKACHFLNVRPEKCIMVGDKLETDILGGIEAGLYGTVWIPTTDKPRRSGDDPKPDFIIRHVTELLRILERGPNAPELEDCSSNGSDGS